jgi:hypothetical protein
MTLLKKVLVFFIIIILSLVYSLMLNYSIVTLVNHTKDDFASLAISLLYLPFIFTFIFVCFFLFTRRQLQVIFIYSVICLFIIYVLDYIGTYYICSIVTNMCEIRLEASLDDNIKKKSFILTRFFCLLTPIIPILVYIKGVKNGTS